MKNDTFIQCFLKDWKNLTREESEAVSERRYQLNKTFVFTEDVILKLRKINGILQEQTIRIRKQANLIHAMQGKKLEEKAIDDFEVEVEMHCWNNRYYVKWDKEFYGNSFYSDYILTLFNRDSDDKFFNDNWNEFQNCPEHPLYIEFHCYLFHHLSDHTYLAWEDILRIDEIWMEIKAWNQFFIPLSRKVKAIKRAST